jgi:hypothetical protein
MNKLNNNVNSAISSLEWAMARCNYSPQSTDEFTAKEFAAITNIAHRTALQTLSRMVEGRLLSSRKIAINGTLTNLYKKCYHQES